LAFCPDGALSHTDALELWGLPTMQSARIHVTIPVDAPQQTGKLQVHRRKWFRPELPFAQVRDGYRVVRLEQAVIESWRWLPTVVRRAPAIVAVRERRTTPERLLEVLDLQPFAAGAGAQRRLFAQLAAGNQSELEIWGHEKVFADKSLPESVTQHRVHIGSRYVLLDRAFLAEMVAVELDGAAYHGSPGQRERDLRRDSALAKLGWVTVRYTHPRLHSDPGGIVDELVSILDRRRKQLRASA
jgi:very-short-patch-repair endonuclease